METWEALTMSRKEVVRPGLMKALVAGQLTNGQVAGALRVSVRHVQRLKGRFRTAGVAGLVHRTRGRPSRRRVAPALRQRVAGPMRDWSMPGLTIAISPRSCGRWRG